MTNPVIENIRRSRGRTAASLQNPRPEVYPPRRPEPVEKEIQRFLHEIEDLEAVGIKINTASLAGPLRTLVVERNIHTATLWNTPFLQRLNVASHLQAAGVELVPPTADKHQLARCDLGITEADFLLAETGTVGLRSSRDRPRAVSLLPRAHLVLAEPSAFRPDLQQVFTEVKHDPYVVFITGASRTGDIEMVSTLGVHGPEYLYVWLVQD